MILSFITATFSLCVIEVSVNDSQSSLRDIIFFVYFFPISLAFHDTFKLFNGMFRKERFHRFHYVKSRGYLQSHHIVNNQPAEKQNYVQGKMDAVFFRFLTKFKKTKAEDLFLKFALLASLELWRSGLSFTASNHGPIISWTSFLKRETIISSIFPIISSTIFCFFGST